jgi:hypothetical protein
MGVKEHHLSHLNATSRPLNVDSAHLLNSTSSVPLYLVAMYRQRRMVLPALFALLTSVAGGIALGDVVSMMILVVCLPTLIAFLAHWKCMKMYGPVYPVNWRIGFAVFFVAAFSLSLGFMLNESAQLMDSLGMTHSIQAAIMIFGVCLPIFLLFCACHANAHCDWSNSHPNLPFPYLTRWIVGFSVIFLIVFVPTLLSVSGNLASPYVVICCSERARNQPQIKNPKLHTILNPKLTPPPPLPPSLLSSALQRTLVRDSAFSCGRFHKYSVQR